MSAAVVTPTTPPRRWLLDRLEAAYLTWRLADIEHQGEQMKRELRNRALQIQAHRKHEQELRVRLALLRSL